MDLRRHVEPVAMLRAAVLAVSLVAVTSAFADEPTRLAKSDVETLVVGKKVRFTRASDGATVLWDVRGDGVAYLSPPNTQRNLTISGSYTLGDDGSLCFKWNNTDKYVNTTDGCYLFTRDAGKTRIVGRRNPERVIGDLVE